MSAREKLEELRLDQHEIGIRMVHVRAKTRLPPINRIG